MKLSAHIANEGARREPFLKNRFEPIQGPKL
jgi:hypothetical protein